MKRIFLLLLTVMAFVNVNAQDDLTVKPFVAKAGVSNHNFDVANSFEIYLTTENEDYTAFTFDLVLPDGINIDIAAGNQDFNTNRIAGSIGRYGFTPNGTFGIDPYDGQNKYQFSFYHPNFELFQGKEGWLIRVYFTTSNDLKPGIYPIYILNLGVAHDDGLTGIKPLDAVSYVKVEGDEGANSILDLENYRIPAVVADALPTYNVVKNGVCESLYITDKAPFYNTKEFTAKKALYKREETGFNWGTICLPFEIYSSKDLSLQALQSISGNTMVFSEVPSTLPYAPYVYCTPEPTALNISVENVTVSKYVDGTYGVAPIIMRSVMKEPVTLEKGSNAYYIANDQFWTPTVNPVNVAPMRAYYDIEGAGVKCFGIEGVSTAINGTEAGATIEGVYNANGAPQNGMKKGVNLVKYSDGTTQKIIIK